MLMCVIEIEKNFPLPPLGGALNPPEVCPGGDDVRVDGLADGKLPGLLVIHAELDGGGTHHGGPRLRPRRRLGSLAHAGGG